MTLTQKLHGLCGKISTACIEWIQVKEGEPVTSMRDAVSAALEIMDAGMDYCISVTAYATANGAGDVNLADEYLGQLMENVHRMRKIIMEESENDDVIEKLQAEGLVAKSEEQEESVNLLEKCLSLKADA